ncbi:lysylphosphatidylglycerol synthase transmembrane domain-containing protein [Paenibacillus albus]|uniref:Phosphatidylglycerol lysyltransferase n=1 Tax=Paenibacillus albus TaxID=2495582 RepID=A0A3Q8X1V6_9BACL|nr:lysylphosphatidylglycerol synthase transmembrane domain-containing protein [Paenibacillus albus]AZN38578.1 flippase-like domain-containing protein [Paenibacillus albus]
MRKIGIRAGGLMMAACFIWLSWRYFHGQAIGSGVVKLLHAPGMLLLMTGGYALSFFFKALAWRLYARRDKVDRLSSYIHPLLVSLLVNHVLPLKLGDLARVGLLARSTKMRWDDALHSVAVMRVLDMASLLLIGSVGALVLGLEASPWFLVVATAAVLGVLVLLLIERYRMGRRVQSERKGIVALVLRHYGKLQSTLVSRQGAASVLLTLISWLLEGAVVYGVTRVLDLPINPFEAIWVTSMTIAGQLFHITPGGIGTYETTLTASLGVLGVSGRDAFAAALLSHGFKFVFAYVTGAVSLAMSAVTMRELRTWLQRPKGEGKVK